MKLRYEQWYVGYGVNLAILDRCLNRWESTSFSAAQIIDTYKTYFLGVNNIDLPKCFINDKLVPQNIIDKKAHWLCDTYRVPYLSDSLRCDLQRILNNKYRDEVGYFTFAVLDYMKVPYNTPHNHRIRETANENDLAVTYNIEDNEQSVRIGKWIKALPVYKDWNDALIEKIVNELKAIYLTSITIKEVSGEDIRKWYHYKQYADNQGSLSNSCMRHNSCQEYFDIYVENDVRMIIALNSNGDLIGRALLWPKSIWNKNYFDDHIAIVDRIYGRESTIEYIKQYCRSQKYVYRKYQSFDDQQEFEFEGDNGIENISKRVKLNLNTKWNFYPYMDTFKIMQNGVLKNYGNGELLTCTDGYTQDRLTCEICENDVNDEDIYYIEGVGDVCNDCCTYVERDDTYYVDDDVTWIEDIGQYVHIDDSSFDYYQSRDILMDDSIEDYDGNITHINNVYEQGEFSIWKDHENLIIINFKYQNSEHPELNIIRKELYFLPHMTQNCIEKILNLNIPSMIDIECEIQFEYRNEIINHVINVNVDNIMSFIKLSTEQINNINV